MPKLGELLQKSGAPVSIEEEVKQTPGLTFQIVSRIGQQPVVCGICTKEGQTSDIKTAIYDLIPSDGSDNIGACPTCVTDLEGKNLAVYAVSGVQH